MANLNPIPGWDNIPQLETTTRARGGAGQPMNTQAQALLNRTEYLQAELGGLVKIVDLAADDGSDLVGFIQAGTGAASRTSQDKLREVVSITDYAQGDGDDAMVARAVAYCKTLPMACLVIPPGNYTATDTWTFDLPNHSSIEFLGRITSSVSAKPAIRIGSSTTNHYGYHVTGINVARSTNDTTSGSIGVEIANVFASSIQTRITTGFTDGILLNGTQPNGGVSYLDLTVGYCVDNKRNLRCTASGTGYCNENNIYGGRFGYSSSYPDYTGTVNIVVDHFVTNRLNNIRFYGPSLEAVNAVTKAATINGRYCVVYHPRMENPGDDATWAFEFGANSEYCSILGKGFGVDTSNIFDTGFGNSYQTKQSTYLKSEAAADIPVHAVQSTSTANAYAYQALNTGGTSTYYVRCSGQLYSASSGYFQTGLRWNTSSGTLTDRGLFTGTGTPEGVVTATLGSIYSNSSGAQATYYVKTSGAGNTGWLPLQQITSGTTASRPATPPTGFGYFDTTLGKPVWWKGAVWVDATGATV